jgi:hypothetical protein
MYRKFSGVLERSVDRVQHRLRIDASGSTSSNITSQTCRRQRGGIEERDGIAPTRGMQPWRVRADPAPGCRIEDALKTSPPVVLALTHAPLPPPVTVSSLTSASTRLPTRKVVAGTRERQGASDPISVRRSASRTPTSTGSSVSEFSASCARPNAGSHEVSNAAPSGAQPCSASRTPPPQRLTRSP